MNDLAVPEIEQMADGDPGSCHLVDADRPAGATEIALDQHDRHSGAPAARDLQRVVLADDDDDALDALAAQVFHRVVEELAGQNGEAHRAREESVRAGSRLDAALDARRAEMGRTDADHADDA